MDTRQILDHLCALAETAGGLHEALKRAPAAHKRKIASAWRASLRDLEIAKERLATEPGKEGIAALPDCVLSMRCYCAGHAAGRVSPFDRCDTRECYCDPDGEGTDPHPHCQIHGTRVRPRPRHSVTI